MLIILGGHFEVAQAEHYYLGLTPYVNPILKCPLFSQVELPLYKLNRVGELGFTVRSFESFWCDENWVYRP